MLNISKRRELDENLTNVVNDFLDNYLYSLPEFTEFQRIDNKEQQVLGVDVKFKLNGNFYICDEKAAVTRINQYLPTFCLELSMLDRSGNLKDGWFLNKDNINDSYLFIWIDKATANEPSHFSQIKKLEVALVRKVKILEFLDSLNWNEKNIRNKDYLIRENKYFDINKNKFITKENLGNIQENNLKFSYSNHLVEQPVNLIIKREIYRNISDYNKIIKVK